MFRLSNSLFIATLSCTFMLSIACLKGLTIWRGHEIKNLNVKESLLTVISPETIGSDTQSSSIISNCRYSRDNFTRQRLKGWFYTTLWQTSESTLAMRFLTSLCLRIVKPPSRYESSCSTGKGTPHEQWVGVPLRVHILWWEHHNSTIRA